MRKPIFTLMGRLLGLAVGASGLLGLVVLGLGPKLADYRVMTVLTASMRPSMAEGSLILQTPVALGRVRVGDAITYRIPVEDRRVVTHRVVEIVAAGENPVVRTKGDANAAPDPWLAQLTGERIWKVRYAVAKAGYLVQGLRHPLTQRLTLVVVPALLALVWLRDIWAPSRPSGSPSAATSTGLPGPAGLVPSDGSASPLPPWRWVVVLAAVGATALAEGAARSGRRPRPRGLWRQCA